MQATDSTPSYTGPSPMPSLLPCALKWRYQTFNGLFTYMSFLLATWVALRLSYHYKFYSIFLPSKSVPAKRPKTNFSHFA